MPNADPNFASDLRIACQRVGRRIRYESTLDVAPHQYAVLVQLEDRPMSPGDLAHAERVSAPSMTRTVHSLEELGLVERQPHPTDGRQILIGLTDAGRELVNHSRELRDSWVMRQLAQLEPEERDLLRAALPALCKVADL